MESFWKKEESNIEIQNIEILNNGKKVNYFYQNLKMKLI